jgi:hypothetical protein
MCAICEGQTEDDVRKKLCARVDRFGWAIQGVEPSGDRLGWVYTIGLVEHFGHPELVMAGGDLFRPTSIIDALGEHIASGERVLVGEHIWARNSLLRIGRVHPRQMEYGLFDMWFDYYVHQGDYVPQLEAVQVLFSSEHFCAQHANSQPKLSRPTDVLGVSPRTRAPTRRR